MEKTVITTEDLCPHEATRTGRLPYQNETIRFAVGDPNGLSSNTWRVWAHRSGDVYISCRDIFQELKISLHMSGRWRVGFTAEAFAKQPQLVESGRNRASEVWDKPAGIKEGVIQAFRMVFPVTELRVRPEDRNNKTWKNVVFVEAGPLELTTSMVIYVTKRPGIRVHGLNAYCLASWSLPEGSFAHLVVQEEPFKDKLSMKTAVLAGMAAAKNAGAPLAEGVTCWLWGVDQKTGARSLLIAGGRPEQIDELQEGL